MLSLVWAIKKIVEEKSLTEIHSFAPSFNLRHINPRHVGGPYFDFSKPAKFTLSVTKSQTLGCLQGLGI